VCETGKRGVGETGQGGEKSGPGMRVKFVHHGGGGGLGRRDKTILLGKGQEEDDPLTTKKRTQKCKAGKKRKAPFLRIPTKVSLLNKVNQKQKFQGGLWGREGTGSSPLNKEVPGEKNGKEKKETAFQKEVMGSHRSKKKGGWGPNWTTGGREKKRCKTSTKGGPHRRGENGGPRKKVLKKGRKGPKGSNPRTNQNLKSGKQLARGTGV